MKSLIYFSMGCSALFAQEFPVQEVLEMAERDSAVRKEWVITRDIGPVRAQEIENTVRLKEILAHHGLPSGYEMDELVEAISQLVLRSSDLELQKSFLEMVPSAGDLWSETTDSIIDRVLLRQGLPQRYGTHLYHEGDTLVSYPIENREILDQLREELNEPSFADYLEVMKRTDQAIAMQNDLELQKIFFHAAHCLFKNPNDYLYYASLEPNMQLQENGEFLAFEDLPLAVAYALHCASVPIDFLYKETAKGLRLSVKIDPQDQNDVALLNDSPIYVYIIERSDYQPHKTYGELFLNRFLASSQKTDFVAEAQFHSAVEALLCGLSQLTIAENEVPFDLGDLLREWVQGHFFFDMTLENEHFEM